LNKATGAEGSDFDNFYYLNVLDKLDGKSSYLKKKKIKTQIMKVMKA
jgi:hypothetical protein